MMLKSTTETTCNRQFCTSSYFHGGLHDQRLNCRKICEICRKKLPLLKKYFKSTLKVTYCQEDIIMSFAICHIKILQEAQDDQNQ